VINDSLTSTFIKLTTLKYLFEQSAVVLFSTFIWLICQITEQMSCFHQINKYM